MRLVAAVSAFGDHEPLFNRRAAHDKRDRLAVCHHRMDHAVVEGVGVAGLLGAHQAGVSVATSTPLVKW
jgi:hypothetical protein